MPDFTVVWSSKANRTYAGVIEYLASEWSEKEIHHFISRTDSLIEKISANPFLFNQYKDNPLIRRAVVHATVILIYHVSESDELISLITFWGTRQDMNKLNIG